MSLLKKVMTCILGTLGERLTITPLTVLTILTIHILMLTTIQLI